VLRSEPDTDAIFCGSDQMARGAADALREAGRRVPDDVALVGYDNWEVFAASGRPPLTTVDMRLRDLGGQAAQRLLAAIDGDRSSGVERHPCRLVIRESTSAARPAQPAAGRARLGDG
ncbi:MAG: substrate-binding domain-containing protein, partial [Streptosporangiaceae bacterium]